MIPIELLAYRYSNCYVMDGTINTSGRSIERKEGGDLKTWKKWKILKKERKKHRIKIRQNTPRHPPSNVFLFPRNDTLRSVYIFLDPSSMPVILRERHCVVNFRSRQFSAAEKQSRGMKYASRRRHFFMRTYHRSVRRSSVCTYDGIVCCATATALWKP